MKHLMHQKCILHMYTGHGSVMLASNFSPILDVCRSHRSQRLHVKAQIFVENLLNAHLTLLL